MAAWLDTSLGPLLDELHTQAAFETTLTIFTSDHGAWYAGKGHAFEAGKSHTRFCAPTLLT